MPDPLIGKIHFSEADKVYGLEILCSRISHKVVPVDCATASACDLLLVSISWIEDFLKFVSLARTMGWAKSQKERGGPFVLCGGVFSTEAPALVAEFCDAVFVGYAEDHIAGLVDKILSGSAAEGPGVFVRGDEVPPPAFSVLAPFVMRKDRLAKKYMTGISQGWNKFNGSNAQDAKTNSAMHRMEIARGCRGVCTYCEVRCLSKYQELTSSEIKKSLSHVPRKSKVSLFAPERTGHSEFEDISTVLDDLELQDFGADSRLNKLSSAKSVSVATGIDGLSERIRKEIKKPSSNKYIVEKIGEFMASGFRKTSGGMLVAYFIAGLPGESKEDYSEFSSLLAAIEAEPWSKNFRMRPILNRFVPRPHTPLADAHVDLERDLVDEWTKALRGGDGSSRWGYRIFETPVHGTWLRAIDTLAMRSGSLGGPLFAKLPDALLLGRPPVVRQRSLVKSLLDQLPKFGLSRETIER